MDFATRLDLFNIGSRFVQSRAQRINPREIFTEGSDINLIIGAVSFMAMAVQNQSIEAANNLLLDGVDDDNLDRWAYDRYLMTRKGAAAAVTFAEIVRPTAAAGAGQVPIGTVIDSLDGIQYTTLTTGVFGPTGLTASAVKVRSAQAGKAFQVGANMLRRFDKPNLLFDQTLQVNNAVAATGGEPAETNDVFRERVRGFWRAARRGTLGAIEFGALEVPGVVSAEAIDVLDNGEPARLVELFIADSSGVANAALAATVQENLLEWRAGGIQVIINTSRPTIQEVLLRLSFRAGVNTSALTNQIRAAVVTYINSLGVNRPLLRNDLGALLSRYRDSGLIPDEGTVLEPLGDVYPARGTTIRTRLENVRIAS